MVGGWNAKCPKCGGVMQEGFVLDAGYGVNFVSRWMPGRPQNSWLTGIKVPAKDQRPISAYRCDRCGYLESYAI